MGKFTERGERVRGCEEERERGYGEDADCTVCLASMPVFLPFFRSTIAHSRANQNPQRCSNSQHTPLLTMARRREHSALASARSTAGSPRQRGKDLRPLQRL